MTIETKPFDAAPYFTAEEDQLDLLNDALANGDAGYIAAAIGTIAKARGMTEVARETGASRQGLYAALSESGNPTIGTVAKVLETLGLQLAVKARVAEHA